MKLKTMVGFRPCLSSVVLVVLALAGFRSSSSVAQELRINEAQSSNGTTLADDRGETPDWVELFNPGPASVELAGWSLSDEPEVPRKWIFQEGTVEPGGFLVVYASGLDRQPHTFPAAAPEAVSGLRIWLSADRVSATDPVQVRISNGQVFIKQWSDFSGGNRHARQDSENFQPRYLASSVVFGGRPSLRFDGVDDALILPVVPATNSFCIVAVVQVKTSHEMDSAGASGVGGVSGQRYLLGAAHGGDTAAGAGLSVGTNGASIYEHGSGYMPALAVAGGVGTTPAVLTMNYSNRHPTLWIRGNLSAVGFPSSRAAVTAPREIGAGAYGAFDGEVAEMLFFDRALTEAEILGLHRFFAAKYALLFPKYYHTNFKLDGEGEPVLLARPDGSVADQMPATQIPRDASRGRQPDGEGEWVFFAQPTPGASNQTPGATAFLSPPMMSVPAGFYSGAVVLELTSDAPGAQIRFTLDGSEPSTNSPLYSTPLVLGSRAGAPNDLSMIPTAGGWQAPAGEVFKIHVVRARAFRANALPSAVATGSFAIDPLGRARYPLPVVSLATDRRNFFDRDIGIYVCGNAPGCNYAQSGDAWERPVHVEFFETNGARVLAQESGVRMHGNTSFGFPIKALRLHPLNQKGGEPFRHRIFPDLPITEFNRLLLRPSGHDHYLTMMRDGLMQNLVRELGLDLQGYRPAVVFINGEFWGIHNLQEAFEKQYFASHHPGVDPEAVDYLEGYAPGAYAYEGDSSVFDQLILYLQSHDLRQDATLAEVRKLMEWENYRDYKVAETFYYRWDIGNQRVWRPRRDDGRLRWILFDCDVGYGGFWAQPADAPWTFNMLAYNLEPNGPWLHYQPGNDHNSPPVTFQLRALLSNAGLKRDFINRCADLMNTTLSTERMLSFIDRMAAEIAPVMAEHCARWRYPSDTTTWSNNVQRLRDFAIHRPEHMRRHVTNQFGLRGWVNLTLRVSNTNAGSIQLNSLRLSPGTNNPWTGVYFKDNAVTIAAVPNPGWRFQSWQGVFGPATTNQTNTLLLSGPLALTAHFEAAPATNPVVPEPFALASGTYIFSRWDAHEPAGTFPRHMAFLQCASNAAPDPVLLTDCGTPWTLPYDRTNRSRFSGAGEEGVAFLNTSDPQPDGGSYLGAALLALNTMGVTRATLVWRAGTIMPGGRRYAIRLQYRPGTSGPFADFNDALGTPLEYQGESVAGASRTFGPIALPVGLLGQPLAQLRWKYYWVAGNNGTRDQLRLDDIMVTSETPAAPMLVHRRTSSPDVVELECAGAPGWVYSLETSTNLLAWETLRTLTVDAQGLLHFVVPWGALEPTRFYRLRWP